MSDIGRGIGDAMLFLGVVAAFFVPFGIGAAASFVLSVFGLTTAAIVVMVIGFLVGVVCSFLIGKS